MLKIKKILFPIDFTENSIKIFPYVLSMAEKYDSTIYLIHIAQDLFEWGGFYVPHASLEISQTEVLITAEKLLDKICNEQLQEHPDAKKIIVSGDPALEILKIIESEDIDLVIMGTHGRKGLDHVIFGSVASNVVKKSLAPTLTVNPYKLKNDRGEGHTQGG